LLPSARDEIGDNPSFFVPHGETIHPWAARRIAKEFAVSLMTYTRLNMPEILIFLGKDIAIAGWRHCTKDSIPLAHQVKANS